MYFRSRHLSVLAGAAILLALGRPGAAQTQSFSFINNMSNSQIVNISRDNGASYFNAYAGEYMGALAGGPTLNIFCTDVTHDIAAGDTYIADTSHKVTDAAGPLVGSYYNGGLASAMNSSDFKPSGSLSAAARASEVAYLSDHYLGASNTSFGNKLSLQQNMAAVNLSIWDIAQDGGDGLSAGSLRADGRYDSQVAALESQASRNSTYQSSTADWIQAPISKSGEHKQDYIATAAVPEPATLPLLLIGIAGMGIWAYRRRQAA